MLANANKRIALIALILALLLACVDFCSSANIGAYASVISVFGCVIFGLVLTATEIAVVL